MKHLLRRVLLGLALAATAQPGRTVLNFNRDWHFKLGAQPSAAAPTYADAG